MTERGLSTVPCPICASSDVKIYDHEAKPWLYFEVFLECRQCATFWTAHYQHTRISHVVMGPVAGPAFVTRIDDVLDALNVWEQDERQCIRTDCTWIAVGYEPQLSTFFPPSQGWIDTSPEEMAQHDRELRGETV